MPGDSNPFVPGRESGTGDEARGLLEEVAGLSEKIELKVRDSPRGAALMREWMSTTLRPSSWEKGPRRANVRGVPKVVVNDSTGFVGAQPEARFLEHVLRAAA